MRAIIGCDAHTPGELDVTGLFQRKREFLTGMGLTVLDTLPGLE